MIIVTATELAELTALVQARNDAKCDEAVDLLDCDLAEMFASVSGVDEDTVWYVDIRLVNGNLQFVYTTEENEEEQTIGIIAA